MSVLAMVTPASAKTITRWLMMVAALTVTITVSVGMATAIPASICSYLLTPPFGAEKGHERVKNTQKHAPWVPPPFLFAIFAKNRWYLAPYERAIPQTEDAVTS